MIDHTQKIVESGLGHWMLEKIKYSQGSGDTPIDCDLDDCKFYVERQSRPSGMLRGHSMVTQVTIEYPNPENTTQRFQISFNLDKVPGEYRTLISGLEG